jgi:hypothetical protein
MGDLDLYERDLSIGKLVRQAAELASCLRDAVDSLGILRQPGLQLNWLDALIERSEAALKDYEK